MGLLSPVEKKGAPRGSPAAAAGSTRTAVASTAAALPCLLTSQDKPLREWMAATAMAAGWHAVGCDNPAGALRQAVLRRFRFAVIDLGPSSMRRNDFGEVVRVLAATPGNLLVVGQPDADPEGSAELWARERGAWLYLPGMDQRCDLLGVCEQALALAEKLHGPVSASGGLR